MKNRNIVQFSAGTDHIALSTLAKYRIFRLFVADEATKSLTIFARSVTGNSSLGDNIILSSLNAIQFDQCGVYHCKRPEKTCVIFVVVEPSLGNPKRGETYHISVSEKQGRPTINKSQFFKETKTVKDALLGSMQPDTARVVLDYAIQKFFDTTPSTDSEKPPEKIVSTEVHPIPDSNDTQTEKTTVDLTPESSSVSESEQQSPSVKLTSEQYETQIRLLLSEVSCKEACITNLERELGKQKSENDTLQQELAEKQVKIQQLTNDLVIVHTQTSAIPPLQLQVDTATIKKDEALKKQQKEYEDRLHNYRKIIFMLGIMFVFLLILCSALLGIIVNSN